MVPPDSDGIITIPNDPPQGYAKGVLGSTFNSNSIDLDITTEVEAGNLVN